MRPGLVPSRCHAAVQAIVRCCFESSRGPKAARGRSTPTAERELKSSRGGGVQISVACDAADVIFLSYPPNLICQSAYFHMATASTSRQPASSRAVKTSSIQSTGARRYAASSFPGFHQNPSLQRSAQACESCGSRGTIFGACSAPASASPPPPPAHPPVAFVAVDALRPSCHLVAGLHFSSLARPTSLASGFHDPCVVGPGTRPYVHFEANQVDSFPEWLSPASIGKPRNVVYK